YRAPIHKLYAYVRRFVARKILLRLECVHESPLLHDRRRSFQLIVSDQRQFPLNSIQFALLLRQQSLQEDCTQLSSTPVSHMPTLQALSSEDLRSTTAG